MLESVEEEAEVEVEEVELEAVVVEVDGETLADSTELDPSTLILSL